MEPNTEVYTDGSCLGNGNGRNSPGGWAFIWLDTKDDKEWLVSGGEKETTNNRMELEAAIRALDFCAGDLTIYSDSLYVIKGITEWIFGWKKRGWAKVKNRGYWERLDRATQGRRVEWRWVKAHSGNFYNEKVDKLARREAEDVIRPPVF